MNQSGVKCLPHPVKAVNHFPDISAEFIATAAAKNLSVCVRSCYCKLPRIETSAKWFKYAFRHSSKHSADYCVRSRFDIRGEAIKML